MPKRLFFQTSPNTSKLQFQMFSVTFWDYDYEEHWPLLGAASSLSKDCCAVDHIDGLCIRICQRLPDLFWDSQSMIIYANLPCQSLSDVFLEILDWVYFLSCPNNARSHQISGHLQCSAHFSPREIALTHSTVQPCQVAAALASAGRPKQRLLPENQHQKPHHGGFPCSEEYT